MKIAILGAQNDIHLVRWVNALAERGHKIYLLTCHPPGIDELSSSIHVIQLKIQAPFGYFLNVIQIKRILNQLKPDILHAHYASGYGTLGMLSQYKPYIISVWGDDVDITPKRNLFYRQLITKNLKSANCLCVTSIHLLKSVQTLSSELQNIHIIPFGVEIEKFNLKEKASQTNNTIILGTIKKLYPKYGIDILIKAFHEAKQLLQRSEQTHIPTLRLMIVGGGPDYESLKKLARDLNLDNEEIEFIGKIPHAMIHHYLQEFDIFLALSRTESFGVAVIEASATQLPVIITNVDGLPETARDQLTGYLVDSEDYQAAAHYIVKLATDPTLRVRLGKAGRAFVEEHFTFSENVKTQEKVYKQIVQLGASDVRH